MLQTTIFGPMTALALLTLGVLGYTGYKRFSAGFAGRVKGSDFRYGETANVLEMPVLFYAVCLALYATGHVTSVTLCLAWLYVASRAVHTAIHLAYNRILYRFAPYALSNVVLLGLWLWFAAAVFS
jgi:hypothetical protein